MVGCGGGANPTKSREETRGKFECYDMRELDCLM